MYWIWWWKNDLCLWYLKNLVINHLIWLQINGSHFFNLFASIVANACTNALIVNYPDNKINKYLEKNKKYNIKVNWELRLKIMPLCYNKKIDLIVINQNYMLIVVQHDYIYPWFMLWLKHRCLNLLCLRRVTSSNAYSLRLWELWANHSEAIRIK